jgi:uncharacterized membrane protein
MSAPEGPTGPPGDAPQPIGEKASDRYAKFMAGAIAFLLISAIAAALGMILVWALIGLYNLLFG